MIRKLMASTAVLALMSTGAFTIAQAQDNQTTNPPVLEEQAQTTAPAAEAKPTTELAASQEALTPDEPAFVTAYIGKSVYSSEDPESDNIGDINDLILSEDGSITHAVVGVGGFLGIGEKNVAVPFDELKVVEKDGDIRFVYASTKEQLEAAPALDRTAFDPAAHAAAAQETASTDTGAGSLAPAEPSQDMAAAPAETATAEQPAEATTQTEQEVAANAPAHTTTAPAEDMTAAPAEDQVAANTAADKTVAPAALGNVEFLTANAEEILATDFIGKTVYGADNESIGEISDLVLEPEGKTRVALIDVGGFLGVGEKTVGLPFDQLEIYKAEDGSDQVKVAMSKEQLDKLPTMEVKTAEAPAPLATEQPAGDMAAAPAEPATTDQPAQTAKAPTDEQMTTGSIDTSADYTVATQDVSANQLIGATVYGTDDSNIGEVHDVIFNKNGDIDAAIIDVGGFLGIGEKPVGVKFSALNVRTDENGKLLVMINATKDQLDQAPKFEEPKTVQ